ncbi:MAG: hypothetical protein NW224_26870 [Leptolyngbyaceae cyanobacterium bins.302]|nr:hypothetical protein [Leptolyngbyaceae cyanobacterium bins.302]
MKNNKMKPIKCKNDFPTKQEVNSCQDENKIKNELRKWLNDHRYPSAPCAFKACENGKLEFANSGLAQILSLFKSAGTCDISFANKIHNQVLATTENCTEVGNVNASLAAIFGIQPLDEIEGMLGAQMVATHNLAMQCMASGVNKENSIELRTLRIESAVKLCRTFTSQMEALNRYRNRGQQRVKVEHVTVQAGGQAIVGNVLAKGGGGEHEK